MAHLNIGITVKKTSNHDLVENRYMIASRNGSEDVDNTKW